MAVNQIFGLLFFIGMALLLPKNIFGQVNWAVAVSATITIISSLGFDHVIVRKLSGGAALADTIGVYIAHTFGIAALVSVCLVLHQFIAPAFYVSNPGFIFILFGLLASFLSMPYKQLANGRERFWHLALMSISGNVLKVVILLLLHVTHQVSVEKVGLLFLISGLLEWLICAMLGMQIVRRVLLPVVKFLEYKSLVLTALPQMGVILLDSAFARLDWILMGIISTNAFTADYSFSYKAYESSRLPLLIIAPIILPKISRLYSKGGITQTAATDLNFLWRAESIICIIIPLLLNVCWVDVVDLVTDGQYGESTKWLYAVLSLSLPMAYIINFLWTIAFAQGKLRMTFYFSAITLVCNIALNLCLIPLLDALGAAIAFTGSTAVQMILYASRVREPALRLRLWDFVKTVFSAAAIVALVGMSPVHWTIKLGLAGCSFLLLVRLTGIMNWRKQSILQKKEA